MLDRICDFNKEGNTCFLSGLGEAQLPVLALAGVFESVRLLPLMFLGILLSFFQLQFSFFEPDLCVYITTPQKLVFCMNVHFAVVGRSI